VTTLLPSLPPLTILLHVPFSSTVWFLGQLEDTDGGAPLNPQQYNKTKKYGWVGAPPSVLASYLCQFIADVRLHIPMTRNTIKGSEWFRANSWTDDLWLSDVVVDKSATAGGGWEWWIYFFFSISLLCCCWLLLLLCMLPWCRRR